VMPLKLNPLRLWRWRRKFAAGHPASSVPPPPVEAHTLEGRLAESDYASIAKACTADWAPDFVASEAGRGPIEEVVFRRHDRTLRYVVPWVNRARPLAGRRVVDFGSGCGSSSLAFSHFAREVAGFEIAAHSVAAFETRMRTLGRSNVNNTQAPPETILDAALAAVDGSTTILLNAVVEHLTEREQVDYLRAFWEALSPGELLVITETPNYHAVHDSHTFGGPYAHTVPDELFLDWLQASAPDLRFRELLLAAYANGGRAALLEQRRRLGLGVSHHAFELAFRQDLNDIVIGDGWDPEMLAWFPVSHDDRLLVETNRRIAQPVPIGFARGVLSFIFRKPRSGADVEEARAWNRRQRAAVLAHRW
jgi:SAM-dependent methyltransferase